MTCEETLISAWKQVLVEGKDEVTLGADTFRVSFLRSKKLKAVDFRCGDFEIAGIQQNPNTASRWAELARQGKRIMQFRCAGRYIANVCEGKLNRYSGYSLLNGSSEA